MSKIALSGSASGSGTFTLAAPNSDSSYTLNLPQVSGGTLVSTDASGNVGIGTNSPTNLLDVRSSTTNANINLRTTNVGSSAAYIATTTTRSWYFGADIASLSGSWSVYDNTSSAQRLIIDSSGNVGIGTSNPQARLHLASTSGFTGVEISDSTDRAILGWHTADGFRATVVANKPFIIKTNDTERVRITAGGDVYCGQSTFSFGTSPTTGTDIVCGGLIINATRRTTGAAGNTLWDSAGTFYRSTSSIKYKRDVENMTYGLTDVLQLRPVTFASKSDVDGDSRFGGFIAEEIDALGLKEFVMYDQDGSADGLQYANMVALLTKAIQEQQEQINQLKAEVAALKSA